MENASKALLIAGSILICILIIGVGMLVYSSIEGTVGEGIQQISQQEREMFNRQWSQYDGTRVNGANVKALINKVKSNNSQIQETKDPKYVHLTGITDASSVNTARTYTVKVTDTDNDGLMNNIEISDNTK